MDLDTHREDIDILIEQYNTQVGAISKWVRKAIKCGVADSETDALNIVGSLLEMRMNELDIRSSPKDTREKTRINVAKLLEALEQLNGDIELLSMIIEAIYETPLTGKEIHPDTHSERRGSYAMRLQNVLDFHRENPDISIDNLEVIERICRDKI